MIKIMNYPSSNVSVLFNDKVFFASQGLFLEYRKNTIIAQIYTDMNTK